VVLVGVECGGPPAANQSLPIIKFEKFFLLASAALDPWRRYSLWQAFCLAKQALIRYTA
jgi:hypothetical protein